MTSGAERRILNCADSREIKVSQKAVSVAANTRERTSERDEGAQVPQWKPVCQRILMRHYVSSLSKDKSGYER